MTASNSPAQTSERTARLYRMVMPDHICPFGLKSKALLESRGYTVEDHHLTTREETDAFQAKHDVSTTPQTFIGGERIGGYDELRAWFGKPLKGEGETSYQPVIVLFVMAALMGAAISWLSLGTLDFGRWLTSAIPVAMCLLAVQKLRDVESFSTMFLNYDLLGRRWVRYGYLYPFGEALAGVLMLAGTLTLVAAPVAIFIGGVGAVSVFKAVYLDKRELTCACMGGDSQVPLGFISLSENLMMLGMGLWMLAAWLA